MYRTIEVCEDGELLTIEKDNTMEAWSIFIFMIRRLVWVLTVYLLRAYAWFTLCILVGFQLLWMGYNITVQPLKYQDRRAHYLEVLSDCTIYFITVLVMMFSELIPESSVRYTVGWVLLGVSSTVIAFNLGLTLIDSLKALFTSLKQCY
jgi:hypothetical protein